MARYIDVEPLEDKLKEHIRKTESELMLGALSTFLRLLDITPTADVVPVRHVRWEEINDLFLYRCSVCGEEFYIEIGTPQENRYCPHCGARMDGGNNETD